MSHTNESFHIAVLLKQTFDTEEKIAIHEGKIQDEDVKWVVNPYDEYAIEAAIQWKEQHGGHITVYTAGPDRAGEALRTALAMGADEAVHIELEDQELQAVDEWGIAQCLYHVLKDRQVDLLLAGNFSIDQGSSQTAIRLSTLLQWPHAGAITKLERVDETTAAIERDAEGDTEYVNVSLPALFTCQQGLNEPRYPSLAGIMKAKKKPVTTVPASELLALLDNTQKTQRELLELPPPRMSSQMLQGSAEEQVQQLIQALRSSSNVFEA